MNNRVEQIRKQLTQVFKPNHLEVIDDSEDHIGHHSYDAGGHFTVIINAPDFEGKSLVQSHRLIYQALDELMKSGEIHALQIKIS